MEKTEEKGIFNKTYNWFKNASLKSLFRAVLVAFIVIIILLSVSYIPVVMRGVSSSLTAALYSVFVPAERASVTADKQIINSGEDFIIAFKKAENMSGLFTVSYACSLNANLLSVETNGLKKINCDTPYYLLENETSIRIRSITKDSIVRLMIDGSFENNDTQKIEKVGVVRVTVKNDSAGTMVTAPVSTTTKIVATTTPKTSPVVSVYTAPVTQPVYYGKPDLAVRTLQVGLLNERTNLITTQNQFNSQDTVGIKFEIRNDGDANTGLWSFAVSLPSISTPVFNSATQISLRPGESIIFTLGFGTLSNQSSNLVTIKADSLNAITESNELNNLSTTVIINLGYNNNNYYSNTTGCYVNGIFTYNCSNNNYNSNYNYNNGLLGVTCYGEPNNPETGDHVHWYANAIGGDGDYEYDWTGTNSLNSSSQNPTKTYSSIGTKNATVTVQSNGTSVSQTCSVYVD